MNYKEFIYFDYPLDYEITEYGDYYHDPSISLDKPTWLYRSTNKLHKTYSYCKDTIPSLGRYLDPTTIEEEDTNLGKKPLNQIPA